MFAVIGSNDGAQGKPFHHLPVFQSVHSLFCSSGRTDACAVPFWRVSLAILCGVKSIARKTISCAAQSVRVKVKIIDAVRDSWNASTSTRADYDTCSEWGTSLHPPLHFFNKGRPNKSNHRKYCFLRLYHNKDNFRVTSPIAESIVFPTSSQIMFWCSQVDGYIKFGYEL